MYRMASNRFVSRSSRLLYFLTVSDTYCRSIIDFIDQKDDGFFALFFATDPRSGFEFGFASCLLDFGRLVAALQALSFSLIVYYVFSRGHPSVPILSRGQGVAFLLICFVVPKHFIIMSALCPGGTERRNPVRGLGGVHSLGRRYG